MLDWEGAECAIQARAQKHSVSARNQAPFAPHSGTSRSKSPKIISEVLALNKVEKIVFTMRS